MSYVLIVGTATTENRIADLHVLAVTKDLPLADAMRLLGERPAGTVGRIQRLPAALPEVGAVLRFDAQGRATFNRPRRAGGQP
jgi:hypothetical protein